MHPLAALNQCLRCEATCCSYIVIELDEPRDAEDWDRMRWYAAHRDASVYRDSDGCWQLQVDRQCVHIGGHDLCTIYARRPAVCRDYSPEDCEFVRELDQDIILADAKQVDRYVARLRRDTRKGSPWSPDADRFFAPSDPGFVITLDEPEDEEDWDTIRWYVSHQDIWVWLDEDGDYLLQIDLPLEDDPLAPDLRGSHPPDANLAVDSGETDDDHDPVQFEFQNIEDVDRFLASPALEQNARPRAEVD